jgi:hypothetical protein
MKEAGKNSRLGTESLELLKDMLFLILLSGCLAFASGWEKNREITKSQYS